MVLYKDSVSIGNIMYILPKVQLVGYINNGASAVVWGLEDSDP